jgi:hypothetical protein
MCIFLGQKKYGIWGTFLRNFKFYAKTLTKLHDLTVIKKDSLAVEELLSDLVLEVPDPDHKLAADATPTVRCPLQPLHADCAFMVLTK